MTLAAFQSLWCHNGILASVTSPSGDVDGRLELQLHLSATCPVLLFQHFLFYFFFWGGRAIHYTNIDMQQKKPQVSNGRPSTAEAAS